MIMRHGEAIAYREPDHTRPLTGHGKSQCETAGYWLQKNLKKITNDSAESVSAADLALVSPYLRTQQTYRAVAKQFRIDQQTTIDTITPVGNAAQCADLIHGYATDTSPPKCIMVITHMPLVSLLSDKLCAGFNAQIFQTADILVIDYDVKTAIGKKLFFYHGEMHEI